MNNEERRMQDEKCRMKYDGLIKKIYYDPAGFGTVQETYKDVKKLDSSITVKDVRDWFERNVERKNNLED